VSGFLVGANQRAAFAEKALTLLGDVALCRRFGAAAAERVDRHFRWDGTVRQVDKIYQEAVDEFARRPGSPRSPARS